MASSESGANRITEEGDIDRDRIIDGNHVPEEYFCPICQYLLWKPRSCSSCQHLFCQKCIYICLNNANRCPFRCEPFRDERCPPSFLSLLSRVNIHCQNGSFGCTQILPYDKLEYHEKFECKYLTYRCSECEKLVLISEFAEHRGVPGLCIACPIKCTICQNYIEKLVFLEHFHQCCQQKIEEIKQREAFDRDLQAMVTGQQVVTPNPAVTFFQNVTKITELVEQQKRLSRLPSRLKGVDEVRRAREQNCGHFYHILMMLQFVLLNWSKAPFFIFTLAAGGFFAMGIFILGVCVIFYYCARQHLYNRPFCLVLLIYLLSYGTSIFFKLFSDSTIIFFVGMFMFLIGCSSRVSLETLEMDSLFSRTILSIIFCCVGILIMEIILLLIRFCYWLLPTSIGICLFTFISAYLGLQIHRVYMNRIATRTN